MFEGKELLEIARTHYDFTGYCPEKGRSHDSRACCICGKTIQDDKREAMGKTGESK